MIWQGVSRKIHIHTIHLYLILFSKQDTLKYYTEGYNRREVRIVKYANSPAYCSTKIVIFYIFVINSISVIQFEVCRS